MHGVRVLGWTALFELVLAIGAFSVGLSPEGQVGWMAAAAVVYVGVGAALGAAIGRIPHVRGHPEREIPLVVLVFGVLAFLLDGAIVPAGCAVVGGVLAWLRWRLPGKPSRVRSVFRVVFAVAVVALLVALGAKPAAAPVYASGPVPKGPSVVVFVLDTVRRDHLSTYDYARDTSPVLSSLAEGGLQLEGLANANWSVPSHGTILTGRYAGDHHAEDERGILRPDVPTLQGLFGGVGYDTVIITGNPWICAENGLARDFDTVYDAWASAAVGDGCALMRVLRRGLGYWPDKGGEAGTASLASWLEGRTQPERPFFAVINLFEAHAPYARVEPADAWRYVPEGTGSRRVAAVSDTVLQAQIVGAAHPVGDDAALAIDLYDGAVRAADAVLGRQLDVLRQHGAFEDTIIVVVGDHGEHLGEHGMWGHDGGVYEPVLGIPFVITGPGIPRGVRSPAEVGLIDVAPTVLSAAGHPELTAGMHGKPVQQRAVGDALLAEQFLPFLVQVTGPTAQAGDLGRLDRRRRAVRVGDWKLMTTEVDGMDGPTALFDLASDPGESKDRLATAAEGRRVTEDALVRWQQDTGIVWPDGTGSGPVSSDWAKPALEALGYVQ